MLHQLHEIIPTNVHLHKWSHSFMFMSICSMSKFYFQELITLIENHFFLDESPDLIQSGTSSFQNKFLN